MYQPLVKTLDYHRVYHYLTSHEYAACSFISDIEYAINQYNTDLTKKKKTITKTTINDNSVDENTDIAEHLKSLIKDIQTKKLNIITKQLHTNTSLSIS